MNTLQIWKTGAESPGCDGNGNTFDHTAKLLHLAWHPTENLIAWAAANSLYMYYAWKTKTKKGQYLNGKEGWLLVKLKIRDAYKTSSVSSYHN